MTDTMKEQLRQQAISHAKARKEHALRAVDLNSKIAYLDISIRQRETIIEGEIASAVDEQFKPIFSNSEKRKAELQNRMNSDKFLIVARDELEKKKLEAAQESIEATYHADMKNILRDFARNSEED